MWSWGAVPTWGWGGQDRLIVVGEKWTGVGDGQSRAVSCLLTLWDKGLYLLPPGRWVTSGISLITPRLANVF